MLLLSNHLVGFYFSEGFNTTVNVSKTNEIVSKEFQALYSAVIKKIVNIKYFEEILAAKCF
jgi:hypothetical protein